MNNQTETKTLPKNSRGNNYPKELDAILPIAFGGYDNIQHMTNGGTHYVFTATHTDSGDKRIISVDRNEFEGSSVRGERHTLERNCTASADAKAFANDPMAEQKGILTAVDSKDLASFGYSGTALVRRFYPSKTLDELVTNNGEGLELSFAIPIMRQIFDISTYLQDRRLVHRDLSRFNILVGNKAENQGIVRVTDNSNVGKVDELEEKFMPTMGSATIAFPKYLSQLTDKPQKYGFAGEVHALAENALFLFRGKPVAEFDPDKKEGRVIDSGESLFDESGQFKWDLYETAHKEAISKLNIPKKLKKVLANASTLDEKKKYSSPRMFKQEFERALIPTGLEKLAIGWKEAIALTAGVGVLAGGMYIGGKELLDRFAKKTLESKPDYIAVSDWVDKGERLESNLLDIKVGVTVYDKNHEMGKDFQNYPKDKVLRVKPGDSLAVRVKGFDKPSPSNGKDKPYMLFPGKMFIEGVANSELSPNEFRVYPFNSNTDPRSYHPGGVSLEGYKMYEIPTNFADGVYTLVVQTFNPKMPNTPTERELKIAFEGESAIDERRVKFIVGTPKNDLTIRTIAVRPFDNHMRIDSLTDKKIREEDFVQITHIPELKYSDTNKYLSNGIFLPPEIKETPLGDYTLMTYANDGTNSYFLGAYPVSMTTNNLYGLRNWKLSRSPTNFAEKIVSFRKQIEGQ